MEGWVWVAYEPYQRRFLALWFSWKRSILTAELFLRKLVKLYGRHPVYTDGAPFHPEACRSIGLEHRPLSSRYRSLIERAIQYVKDRTERFNNHYPCRKDAALSTYRTGLKPSPSTYSRNTLN